ncbi:glycoside hydrolase family 43 protein [Pontibacter harenae]|uniref:glycoside hydrolase family 43 protein n=1 Tax=Pontibacter harenae TaxID=2894083 RepID=UPI001E4041B8|nr:glycoside hydrolase family 43 protein [Pontibacter harenae]MCC9166902.1 glycoside hydrolase family 43 protein [Pontibacter harenae]
MRKGLSVLMVYTFFFLGCTTSAVEKGSSPATANVYFTNPITDGADPWVIKKDGYYYYCGSGMGGIYISKSRKLTEPGERVVVWRPPAESWNSHNIWAPELHFFNGKWYIYYAAAKKAGGPFLYQQSGVLESASEDPFGAYLDKGRVYTGDNIQDTSSVKWAIDLTPLSLNGQLYALWSGWENNAETDRTKQHLYIARMSNPWTISSNRVRISSPTEPWETGGELDLNEGPQVLKHQGKVFIIYSTRESWLKEYRLGQLALSDTTLSPMEPASWVKSGPVFQGNDQVFGVGHCSFTKSPDGTEDWIAYHTKKSTAPGWNRDIRLQEFTWHADGSTDFGEPIPAGVPIKVPSGEEK